MLIGGVAIAIDFLLGGGDRDRADRDRGRDHPWRGARYFYSDKIALAASRAKPADGPEYQRYHNLVEGLCIAAGLPKPRLYVVDDPAPNAFATGRNPKHAALAVTTGLLEMMNRVELEGVIAHELCAREELRHPRVDDRGHRGRRDRADRRPRPALHVVRRPA